MNHLWNCVSSLFVLLVLGMDMDKIVGFSLLSRRGLFTGTKAGSGNTVHHSFDLSSRDLISRHSTETDFVSQVKTNSCHKPIELPTLSTVDLKSLARGERVQKQSRSGRSGFGMVVVEVNASADSVFMELTKFERYDSMIPTVRSVKIYGKTDNETRAEFCLSKFCLRVNVIHSIMTNKRMIHFKLDGGRPNLVMRSADGFWWVEQSSDRPGVSRVWLSASIVVSRLVPTLVVDYAAGRALPRATGWLQSHKFDSS